MRLDQLIAGTDLTLVNGSGEVEILDLTDDSRRVTPGALFLARPGPKTDGRQFIQDALTRGAVAIIAHSALTGGQMDRPSPPRAALVQAPAVDQALAGRLAERFFGQPSRQLQLVGITGTKGKTTIAFLVQQLLQAAGRPCGMIGTVYVDDGKTRRPAELTTPGAIDFSRYLGAMVANGCQAAVAEFSSHALHQGRVAALKTDVAVFTNLTGDHLDYHGTMEAYARAKAILFTALPPEAWAIINADDPYAADMLRDCGARVIACTLQGATPKLPLSPVHTVSGRILSLKAASSPTILTGPWGQVEVNLPLVGRHNVMNALQAATAVWALTRTSAADLGQALAATTPPPGRFERVRSGSPDSAVPGPTVLVDYAHTHDALEKALEALKPLTRGRLIVMFGCGGDRDRTKRPKMAAAACRLADVVIITSDNPRTEDPQTIIREVLAGVPSQAAVRDLPAGGVASVPACFVEADRGRAIAGTIALARAEDVVLLAGKGHEDYQIIGTTKRHFDDREEAARALARWRPPA